MAEEITVNDGKGLLDNIGLIDSLIVDCNELPKTLFNGQYARFCGLIVETVQKLALLRDGVKNDIQSRDNNIKELLAQIETLRAQIEKGE